MTIPQIEGSQLGGDVSGSDTCMVDVEVEGLTTAAATGKRKRGRPPRRQPKPQPPLHTKEDEEEDVCFICFDGGTLVLCDRRGCPKAYHPTCIKRDEAFFRSKAKWTCGWHICSSCEKASHHMCYTCTYSLCRGCTKIADYFSVRGNKGFCGTCFRTIMLIENIPVGNMAMVQVDFDDKTSWEYLFKFYWVCLKTKLGLTVNDLVKAKNAWKGDELPKDRYFWNRASTMAPTGLLLNELQHGSGEKGSKVVNQPELIKKENSHMIESSIVNKSAYLPHGGVTWATKELLEFVAYMKNGDVSILSQFDVRDLLLDYIKRNNLSDPHQKSEIICDSRLITLFGKARIGHFEMLKLLEDHFLIKDNSTIEASVRAGVPDAVSRRVEGAECGDGQMRMESDRRRKLRKKADGGGSQINVNPNEYAAVDVHNINLLYLRRCLMENLLDDADKFHEKVVGSFVRIKISGGDQKLDAYRLVPVIGTSKVPEAYAVGTRTTDVMLEILNLDKEEVVSIDGISNQDFSEDECRRLRQSVKCGLVKRLSVGEILQKAVMLQPVKVTDWLEVEVLRLNHLCDQALEKGHKKQHREYAERLEALKSSNERQRLLLQIPKVRADPSMDPNYESEDDLGKTNEKKQGGHIRAGHSGLGRKKSKSSSVNRGSTVLNDRGKRTRSHQSPGKSWVVLGSVMTSEQNNQVLHHEISSEVASAVKPQTLPEGRDSFASDIENEKLWHYQDPSGKVQGPFAMMQLRKWSVNGLFPLDLRVWRIDEKQDDSILLTDALIGSFRTEPPPSHEVSSSSPDHEKSWECGSNLNQSTDKSWTDNKNVESCCKSDQNSSSVHNNRKSELMNTIFGSDSPSWTASATVTTVENAQAHSSVQSSDLSKSTNSTTDQSQMCDKNSSPPSSSGNLCDTPSPQARIDDRDEKLIADLDNVKDNLNGTIEDRSKIVEVEEKRARKDDGDEKSIADLDNVKDNSNGTIEDHSKVVEVEEKRARKDDRDEKSIADLDNVKDNSSGTIEDHSKVVEVEEKRARKDDRDENLIADLDNVNVNLNGTIEDPSKVVEVEDPSKVVEVEEKPTERGVYSSHSPGKNLEMLALNSSSSRWASSSGVVSENKSLNISDLLSPKAEHSNEGLNCQAGGNRLPASSDIAVQDSGPSWSTSSCLVVGGAQIPEIGGEWCGYSTAPAKPSAEDWNSNVVPSLSLKPTTVASDHAAMQTSGSGQVMETHLTIDAGGWQPIGAEGQEAEFSLADESVSDLLAEVEAMESLGGLPSPTSRMTCGGEMAHGSDNDCFTSIEDFGPLPDLAKNHALSTSDDLRLPSHLAIVNDPQTQLSHVPSHTSVREPLASQMLSQFAGSHEPLQASQVHCQNSLTNELGTSHMHCQSNQATGTVKLPKTHPFGPQSLGGQSCDPADRATGTVRLPKTDPFGPQSLSGQSCDPAEVRGDAKHGDVSVKQWEAGTELQGSTLSNFSRGKSDSKSQRSPPHQANANSGSIKGITIPNRGSTAKGHPNMISDTYHGTVQHHDGRNAVASAGNSSSLGGHSRHGGEKSFALRDHRGSNPHGRDSGYARDRSSSWNRQPSYGVANGGHAFRPAPKGQRVCKYYESGYCRRGASCTYWHPRP